MSVPQHNVLLPTALAIKALSQLKGKHVVLASASPRRKDILESIGIQPKIVPSKFAEDLPTSDFEDLHEYPVATATQKAVEVYERLVSEDPDDAPDLVIGADTIVLTQAENTSLGSYATASAHASTSDGQEILEKPADAEDNLRMLLDLNGRVCEVVTGVSIVYPILSAPGYEIRSFEERSLVHFADNPPQMLKAYVDTKEGIDRAGGFAIQGAGALLIAKVNGDYNNVVGFPASSFVKFLGLLEEEEEDFLKI